MMMMKDVLFLFKVELVFTTADTQKMPELSVQVQICLSNVYLRVALAFS